MTQKLEALGMLELSSIGVALQVQDAMLKAAEVQLLLARTICSGKYIVLVGGQPSAVISSLRDGKAASAEALIDELFLPHVDPRVFPAITGGVPLRDEDRDALGILEAFSVTSIIEGADAAVKAAEVTLFRIHIAMAIGGKGYLMLTGKLSDVESAVHAGAQQIARRGLLVSKVVIPRPDERLYQDVI
jgi:microcompartment protein CcmL/EutN